MSNKTQADSGAGMIDPLNNMERHCREQLAMLLREYNDLAKPWIDQLVRIHNMRPPAPILLDVLPTSSVYLDPPDGDDVSPLEQLQRMAKDAARHRYLRDANPADGELWIAMGTPNTPGGVSCWRHEEADTLLDGYIKTQGVA